MVRQGGSRVFFDVVGQMQAAKLISDAEEMSTVVQAIVLDAFDGIKGSLDGIFDSVGAAIEAVREPALALGESQIYFRKFFDFDGVEQYEDAIIDLGVAFGFTGTEALEAGARMAQLGGLFGSGESVVAGTAVGTAFGMIGGMETEEAQKRLISLAQQTGFIYEGVGKQTFFAMDAEEQRQVVLRNSLYVLDQLNTVENNSVATMQQLSTVMDQFSASATIANMSIAEQAALSATLVEAGESASKAGRGLRQILLRIASDTGGAAAALHEYGVATQDINGDLVGLTRIMQQLKDNGFDQLDSAQQMQLATSVAGANHATRFIKIMENFDRVTQLTSEAISRESAAVDELNKVMSSATFQANQMEAAQETLSAQIGEQLLPAMTDAQMAAFGLKTFFHNALDVNSELTGVAAGVDQVTASLVGGATRGMIMAQGMYEVAGGVFETFLNYQSLVISVRVYRAIMKQNVELQNMIAHGVTGQAGAMRNLLALQQTSVATQGKHGFMTGMMVNLEKEAVFLANHKVTLMKKAERIKAAELAAANAATQATSQEVQAEVARTRAKAMAASMTQTEAGIAHTKAQAALTAAIQEQEGIRAIILLKGEDAMIGKTTAKEAMIASDVKVNNLQEEFTALTNVMNAQRELSNADSRHVGILNQETTARIRNINEKRRAFKETLNLLLATGHLDKAQHKQMMTTINSLGADKAKRDSNQLTVMSLLALDKTTLKATFSMQRMSAATSLASMALMMFGDNEDAMQASMILMTASMIPAIISMRGFSMATDRATASTIAFRSVTTLGLGLVAIGAALFAARKLMKNHSEDMQDLTTDTVGGFEDIQMAASDFAFELDKPGGAADLMMDFGQTTAESMDKAEKSVKDFMSAREELFFGFSPSRMNQTLFEQLVNQGVGELYYRTEVNINNNFFGLTVDEMVAQITQDVKEQVEVIAGS
jgi:TP901 family phage tail tape measure protein